MNLPFDTITLFNFPYYVKVFFPELFNLVYGADFEIKYFAKSKPMKRLPNASEMFEFYSNDIRRDATVNKNGILMNLIVDFCCNGVDLDEGNDYREITALKYMIKHRHLEEFWVQSILLKKL